MGDSDTHVQSSSQHKRPRVAEEAKRTPKAKNNWAGRIKCIKLRNFMCHANFEIELNPRVNFISGLNGSGKSAIQTAIVVGLGGSAHSTNRSSALKGLIKQGCTSSTITISLWNNGSHAYRRDQLSNVIVIVREITQSTNTIRICDPRGNTIWNKKKDLIVMLHHFSIYVGNPIAILNQDVSRTLLKDTKVKSKYELFRKAISLDMSERHLDAIKAEIQSQKAILLKKKEVIDSATKSICEMDRKMRLQEDLSKLEKQKQEIEIEYVWSHIANKEEEILKYKLEVNKLKNNMAVDMNNVLSAKDAVRSLTSQRDEIEKRMLAFRSEKMRAQNEMSEKTSLIKSKQMQYNNGVREKEFMARQLSQKQENKKLLECSMANQERQKQELVEKVKMAQTKLDELKNDVRLLECGLQTLNNDRWNIENTLKKMQSDIQAKESSLNHDREELRKNENRIITAGTTNNTNLSVYGRWMPRLVDEIRIASNNGVFREPPRGPIGSYISVKDEKWIPALETILSKQLLSSFYVSCGQDRTNLLRIFERVIGNERQPEVYIGKFANVPYNISKTEVRLPPHRNIFRALNIRDTAVANFLIDTMRIETILLIKSDEDCYKLSCKENIPRNLFKAYNMEADEYRPYPNFCRYSNMRLSRSFILTASSDQIISALREENTKLEETIRGKENTIRLLKNEERSLFDEIKKIKKDIDNVSADMSSKKTEIIEYRVLASTELADGEMINNELNSINSDISSLEARIQTADKELTKQYNEIMSLKTGVENGNKNYDDEHLRKELMDNQLEIDKHTKFIEKENDRKECNLQTLENFNRKIRDIERDIESMKMKYKDAEEIKNPKLMEVLKPMLQGVKDWIIQRKVELDNLKIDIDADFHQLKAIQERTIRGYNNLKIMSEKEKEMLKMRTEVVERYRDRLSEMVKEQFKGILTRRNYQGMLEIDHKEEKLTILMAPTDGNGQLVNANSLSGGERSFSTVSFLIALWSTMKLPFYSMDEYDVFMDGLNRQIITDTLIAFTKLSDNQFVFLTPLDISNVQTSQELSVHRLKDPRD